MSDVDRSIKFRYIRDEGNHPVGVVCVNTNTGGIGWSFCSRGTNSKGVKVRKADRFDRAIGRNIALGRMNYGTIAKVPNAQVQEAIDQAQEWLNKRPANV